MTVIVEALGRPIPELIDLIGFIPMWLDVTDERPAAKQLNDHYQHGGGWRPFEGHRVLDNEGTLKYPGDPQMKPIARIKFRDETIYMYESGWVMIQQKDGSSEVARMD